MNTNTTSCINANPTQSFIQWVGDNACDVAGFLNSHDFYHKNGELLVGRRENYFSVPLNGYILRTANGELKSAVPVRRNGSWVLHDLYQTKSHLHMTWALEDGDLIDIALVQCADGRWYASNDGSNIRSAVLFEPHSVEFKEPTFFTSQAQAERVVCKIVAENLDKSYDSLYPHFEGTEVELVKEYSNTLNESLELNVTEIIKAVYKDLGWVIHLSNSPDYVATKGDTKYSSWHQVILDHGYDVHAFVESV